MAIHSEYLTTVALVFRLQEAFASNRLERRRSPHGSGLVMAEVLMRKLRTLRRCCKRRGQGVFEMFGTLCYVVLLCAALCNLDS